MNRLLSILLALIILLPSFNKIGVLFLFKINQDHIEKVLCVNRDKPEMHCKGTCVLAKMLKAEDERANKEIPQKQKQQDNVLYCNEISKWISEQLCFFYTQKPAQTHYRAPLTAPYAKDIFRPPKFFMA